MLSPSRDAASPWPSSHSPSGQQASHDPSSAALVDPAFASAGDKIIPLLSPARARGSQSRSLSSPFQLEASAQKPAAALRQAPSGKCNIPPAGQPAQPSIPASARSAQALAMDLLNSIEHAPSKPQHERIFLRGHLKPADTNERMSGPSFPAHPTPPCQLSPPQVSLPQDQCCCASMHSMLDWIACLHTQSCLPCECLCASACHATNALLSLAMATLIAIFTPVLSGLSMLLKAKDVMSSCTGHAKPLPCSMSTCTFRDSYAPSCSNESAWATTSCNRSCSPPCRAMQSFGHVVSLSSMPGKDLRTLLDCHASAVM